MNKWFSAAFLCFLAHSALGFSHPPSAQQDTRVREYVMPARVLWQSTGSNSKVTAAEKLLQPFPGQITLGGGPACRLVNDGTAPGILLDFGRELHGSIEITVADLKPASTNSKTVGLRVRFGESAAEAMTDLGGDKNATNDHAVRDQVVQVPWLGSVEVGQSGFRFVRLDLVDTSTMVALRSVRAVYIHSGLPQLGSFKCNDDLINRIWETGAYTVYLNIQNYVWDGIKRDRLVWIGDMHPETSTIGAVFGSPAQVTASLDLIRDETPLPQWMNGISSYTIWWIIVQRDWFRQTGDLAYLRQQHAYLKGAVNTLSKHIGPDGKETLNARFLDWPSSGNEPAIQAGLQALMVLGFDAAGQLAVALKDRPLAEQCRESAQQLRKFVPQHGDSKQASALMVLAGLAEPGKLNREVLSVDGAKRMSTFYGYYVLQARAAAGDYTGALQNIREFWGAMLNLGATTFWEDFNLDWVPNAGRIDELVLPGKKDIHGDYGAHCYIGFRHSLCHGWASGPTAWLSEHVLGVSFLEPGARVVRIQPHLGDLQWAEGTYPTPKGIIKIRHELGKDGKVISKISAPKGVKVVRE